MSKKAKIATVKSSTQNQLDPSHLGQVVFPIHTSWPLYKGSIQPEKQDVRPVLQVDLSRLSTDWPQDLTKLPELGDNPKKDKREQDRRAPLSETVPTEEEMISAAAVFFKNASQEKTAKALKAMGPEAIAALFRIAVEEAGSVPHGMDVSKAAPASPSPASRSADAPPLWAKRTTGREVSPVDWIKMHYGNKDADSWDPMGLTRDVLAELDPPLARAYAKMISRDSECALLGLPPKDVVHIADPVLALARKKQQVQEASARYRRKKSAHHIA
jgi:hypothetical protein